jgi:Ni/Fe-hydrogenase subunit HybB-like protein
MTAEIFGETPMVEGSVTLEQVDHDIAAPMGRMPSVNWWIAFIFFASMMAIGFSLMAWTIYKGIGVWGNNSPVFWGFPIVNFVFWIGIGHAGTLISAILFLFRQTWRNAIARFAEAMTLFAVATAGLFPLLHMGRPWLMHWMFPYPNELGIWVNFRSPLVWDVFAISTYGLVSLLFWYVGLIPDLAALRYRAATRVHAFIYKLLSLGWTGLSRHWQHYERAYLILAGIATPLVVSVHTIVSFDFATSVVPGWHTTILPPYFVAGAVFSGFAMVLTVIIILRQAFGMKHLITEKHLENMNKVLLATSLIVGYAYGVEFFMAWYSAETYERFIFWNRVNGPLWWAWAIMMTCNVIVPQVHWFKRARTSIPIMFVVSILVNVGMWFERFVIIVSSLYRDYLPSAWGDFAPTIVDVGILMGSFGLFFTLTLLFVRTMPVISMTEVKAFLPGAQLSGHPHPALDPKPVEDVNV